MNKGIDCMRNDNAEHKRVELHMHSNMSQLDGVTAVSELIGQAYKWGHKAVAITDHGGVQAFPAAMEAVEKIRANGGDIKPIYGMEAYFVNDNFSPHTDFKSLPVYHLTILVKNKIGLKNLYKLVSLSNLNYFYRKPRIPLSELQKHREGLIIGSACADGEIFQAMLAGKSQKEIDTLAEKYDYFEIQPTTDKDINKRIVELADRTGKLCAATGDVHFKNKDDLIFRKIILYSRGCDDENEQAELFFRTTEEMLKEFNYLGEEKAFEVVVANTNKIADMIDSDVRPIPKGWHTPSLPEVDEKFLRLCWSRAYALYGSKFPEIIEKRLKRETDLIIKNGSVGVYMLARKLVRYSVKNGYPTGTRGGVGASLAAFMLGISEIDPLPPHYRCPTCCRSEFIKDGSVKSGFELPQKKCPDCGMDMIRSGQDIPFETFMGFAGEKNPDIVLNFSEEILGEILRYAESLFGKDRMIRAGTVETLDYKTAYSLAKKYCESHGLYYDEAEMERLALGCTGVMRTTGYHPGGIVIIPNDCEVYDFTPVQQSACDPNSDILTTHFDFHALRDTVLKLSVLGGNTFTLFKRLDDMTGIKMSDVPIDDPLVYRLFTSAEPLKLSENTGVLCGTLGIPEFSTEFVMQMLIEALPKTFSDLVKISGLSHGKNTWTDNTRNLIRDGVCTVSEVIASRDDIILYLTRKGIEPILAYNIAEIIRIGCAEEMFDDELCNEFRKHGIPQWFAESCKRIDYLFPKAAAAEYVTAAVKLAWFKLYYPAEFYAAALSEFIYDIELDTIMNGREEVKQRIDTLRENEDKTIWKENALEAHRLISELMSRGIELLPVDVSKSDAVLFTVENGKIRIPIAAVKGCGRSAALKIKEAVDSGCASVDEIQKKSGVSSKIIEKTFVYSVKTGSDI